MTGRWEALDIAIGAGIVIAVVILGLIVATLVMFRRRQADTGALWMHLLSLVVLPLFLVAVAGYATVEHSKETRFCAACHLTMAPYVADLHRPTGTSLASLHFQHRFAPGVECYGCHADYGVHGTLEAKLTGLRHVAKYETYTYHLPLTMPSPFSNTLCLKCHEGAKRFMAEPSHLEGGAVAPELRANQTECMACHGPAHELLAPKPPARQASQGLTR